ncbi:MAG TPA: DNA/RNA non-specific endonuclease [Tepidisphaeraceae bacterium]|nr:DNA/RNA non-specific endonuclease [Tepidisphaeraceae bacterium]
MERRRRSDGPGPEDYQELIDQSVSTFRGLNRQTQIAVVVLLILGAILAAILYFRWQQQLSQNAVAGTPDMLLGNPSNAAPDPAQRDNYLMIKPYYVLAYNNTNGTPNWVSWRVTIDDLGSAPRKQTFDPDATLPPTFKVVTTREYAGSGFDRGHMCPHSDRGGNEQMSFATFVMTNIIPQAPNVNQKAWAQLENYCRGLVRQHNHLYITSGPIGGGGRGSKGFREVIGGGDVLVPAECFKVVVVVPEDGGSDDLSKINAGTRVITVDMPNDQDEVGEVWDKYRCTPAAIETKTGFHFFGNVRPDVAGILRQKIDTDPIAPPRPLSHGPGRTAE